MLVEVYYRIRPERHLLIQSGSLKQLRKMQNMMKKMAQCGAVQTLKCLLMSDAMEIIGVALPLPSHLVMAMPCNRNCKEILLMMKVRVKMLMDRKSSGKETRLMILFRSERKASKLSSV